MLAQQIGKGAVAVIPGKMEQKRNGDVSYPFRQESDLYYLTGALEPNMVLVVLGESGRSILFKEDSDPKREQWDGKRISVNEAPGFYGVDEAYPILPVSAFVRALSTLVRSAQTVYAPYPLRHEQQRIADIVRRAIVDWKRAEPRTRKFYDVARMVGEMRLRKDEGEIMLLREAAHKSALVHLALSNTLMVGMTERELANKIGWMFMQHGGDPLHAYPPIVATGEHTCTLHHMPTDRVIKEGDLVLVDAGCEWKYYASDITRVYPAERVFTPAQEALYQIVLDAQADAIIFAREGNPLHIVHQAAMWRICQGLETLGILQVAPSIALEKKLYLPFTVHSTSHWLGLDVHDAGNYEHDEGHRAKRVLQPGMVITIEPGIYIPRGMRGVDQKWHGIGIRIEDDILITKDGAENLTVHAPKEVRDLVGGA
jgi:Xaa-Pro aminopeptidase